MKFIMKPIFISEKIYPEFWIIIQFYIWMD